MSKWILDGRPMDAVPDGAFGFVYQITYILTGKAYVGKKQFYSTTSKSVPGKKRRKKLTKESDWRTYCSSSKDVQTAVALLGESAFNWTVLDVCRTKRDLSFCEAKLMFFLDVLDSKFENGEPRFWNRNILNRFFRR